MTEVALLQGPTNLASTVAAPPPPPPPQRYAI
jgi:hypothetical protein